MSAGEGFEEFVAIVEAGSVTAAAKALGLPRTTVSRRLARLEERLAVRLLHRTTRRMALTPQGQALIPRARQVVASAREVEEDVRRLDGVPRGRLRVSTPMGMPAVLASWLAAYRERFPLVEVEVVATGRLVDLVADGFDVALRAGPVGDDSLIARTLLTTRRVAVASPSYLDARSRPETPEQLQAHDCIIGFDATNLPERTWPLLDGGSTPVAGPLTSNDISVRMHLALCGQGIALVTDRMAEPHLADGSLVALLEDCVGRIDRVSLVYVDRTFLDPKVRAFVDLLAAYFAGKPYP